MRYAECHHAERGYAECHYAESLGDTNFLLCRTNGLAYFVRLQVKKNKVLDIFDARTAGTRCGTRRRESWRARLKSWCPCYKTIFPSCFKVGNERTG
jgi:hypothetical protein